jgi:nucleoside-diphosphate-sugar epimerase
MQFFDTIFLTGFPGFIAGRLVERLAGPKIRFILLVQPSFAAKAKKEVAAIAERTAAPLENFIVVEGDITRPGLGINPAVADLIQKETTIVFHLAAVYDLAVGRDIALKVNFDGTKNVNELVRGVRKLKRYNYVSTCYVAGKREGCVLEGELEHQAGFRNHYEESKYLAELEVEKLKGELPVTIYRPSVVCGDSQTGETAKYDGIYYLINYVRKAPGFLSKIDIGNRDVRLNLVPVDFVVNAIVALSCDESAVGKTFHIADPRPLNTEELFAHIAETLGGGKPFLTFPAEFTHGLLKLPFSPALTGLPLFGVPYFFIKQDYDTAAADELLAAHGIRCPSFESYVRTLCDFVDAHPGL